jgi:magnesium-transporting ATPase (P-type)
MIVAAAQPAMRAEVPAADLVVLEAGDAVSADCRVIEAHELAVNNMALTAESTPTARVAERVPAGTTRLEAQSPIDPGDVPTIRARRRPGCAMWSDLPASVVRD